jgi:hypothetical protein
MILNEEDLKKQGFVKVIAKKSDHIYSDHIYGDIYCSGLCYIYKESIYFFNPKTLMVCYDNGIVVGYLEKKDNIEDYFRANTRYFYKDEEISDDDIILTII